MLDYCRMMLEYELCTEFKSLRIIISESIDRVGIENLQLLSNHYYVLCWQLYNSYVSLFMEGIMQ